MLPPSDLFYQRISFKNWSDMSRLGLRMHSCDKKRESKNTREDKKTEWTVIQGRTSSDALTHELFKSIHYLSVV